MRRVWAGCSGLASWRSSTRCVARAAARRPRRRPAGPVAAMARQDRRAFGPAAPPQRSGLSLAPAGHHRSGSHLNGGTVERVTSRPALLNRLLDPERVVVFDGAFGTMLYAKGVFINQCFDELNLRNPGLVREVHQAYKKAGAEALQTNTFGANRLKLAQYGLERQVHQINRQAAALAREVAGSEVLVAG